MGLILNLAQVLLMLYFVVLYLLSDYSTILEHVAYVVRHVCEHHSMLE